MIMLKPRKKEVKRLTHDRCVFTTIEWYKILKTRYLESARRKNAHGTPPKPTPPIPASAPLTAHTTLNTPQHPSDNKCT